MPRSHRTVACSLTREDLRERERQWQELLTQALLRDSTTAHGRRLELRPLVGVRRELDRLLAAERECCPFLTALVETTETGLALALTTPSDATGILDRLLPGPRT